MHGVTMNICACHEAMSHGTRTKKALQCFKAQLLQLLWNANSRSRMLTLGKLANLNHSLNGALLLD